MFMQFLSVNMTTRNLVNYSKTCKLHNMCLYKQFDMHGYGSFITTTL